MKNLKYTVTKYYHTGDDLGISYVVFSEDEKKRKENPAENSLTRVTGDLDEYGLKITMDLMGFRIGEKIDELRTREDGLFFESFALERWNGEDYYP